MAFKETDFTIRIIAKNPHRKGSDNWRAGLIIEAMEGCNVLSIVKALYLMEENRTVGVGDPARWLTHFAGLESGPRERDGWIEILYKGNKVDSTSQYRKLLKSAKEINI